MARYVQPPTSTSFFHPTPADIPFSTGSLAFWAGILLILLRWPFIGFLVQCYGMFILFGEFFKTIAGFAYNIPVVGPYLARALSVAGDKAGADERAHKDLPV